MPVVSEKSEGTRKVPRRWLVASGVLLALLLLLPLVPLVTPVTLHSRDRWLRVYVEWGAAGPERLSVGGIDTSTNSLSSRILFWSPSATYTLPTKSEYLGPGRDHHLRWIHLLRLDYSVEWYRIPAAGTG